MWGQARIRIVIVQDLDDFGFLVSRELSFFLVLLVVIFGSFNDRSIFDADSNCVHGAVAVVVRVLENDGILTGKTQQMGWRFNALQPFV